MSIVVELYGIPRVRAGVDRVHAEGNSLGDVLHSLGSLYPDLAQACIDGNRLKSGFTANLHGERFISAPETPLRQGDTILLMSLDAGG